MDMFAEALRRKGRTTRKNYEEGHLRELKNY